MKVCKYDFQEEQDRFFFKFELLFSNLGGGVSSSMKRELPTTAAPLPPKNGFKKFDFHDKFGFDLNDEQVPIRNLTYAVEGALLRWDYKDLLKVVPFNNTAFFDTRYVL